MSVDEVFAPIEDDTDQEVEGSDLEDLDALWLDIGGEG